MTADSRIPLSRQERVALRALRLLVARGVIGPPSEAAVELGRMWRQPVDLEDVERNERPARLRLAFMVRRGLMRRLG
jgi:hypothetical protein